MQPNDPNNVPSYNDSLPSGSPFNNPMPQPSGGKPVPPGRVGTVSLDSIGEAFELFKPNWTMWVGAIFVVVIIEIMFSAIQGFAIPKQPNGQPQFGPLYFILILVGFVLNQFLSAGMFKMAIQNVKTGRAEIGEVFNVGEVIGHVLIAAILTTIVVYVGIILCIIPGIIAALGLAMTIPLIVDQKLSAIEAMGRSWEAMKGNKGMYFVLGLVLALLNLAGLIACGVGLLATISISLLALAIVYRDLFLGGAQPSQMPTTPVAPIADPRSYQ